MVFSIAAERLNPGRKGKEGSGGEREEKKDSERGVSEKIRKTWKGEV